MKLKELLKKLKIYKPYIGMVMLFSIIPVFQLSEEVKAATIFFLMTIFWIFEILPHAITALMPVALFPILHIVETKTICEFYMNDTIMLFLGGLIIANVVQNCNLHKRTALTFVMFMNKGAPWLMLGIMLNTMFLSMWISNTVTTLMMIPVVETILERLKKSESEESIKEIEEDDFDTEAGSIQFQKMKSALMLSIGYASSIGGTGSLIGTGSNILLKGYLEENFPSSTEVTFASWMIYNIPGMFLLIFIGWIILTFMIMKYNKKREEARDEVIKQTVLQEYYSLGHITFPEKLILSLSFLILLLLWFRKPEYIPGWVQLFQREKPFVKDSVPVIAVMILLFIIPKDPKNCFKSEPILNWKLVQNKTSWGVIILIGGGFALAKGFEISGLSTVLGSYILRMKSLPQNVILAIIVLLTIILTEMVNNIAAASLIVPILKEVALTLKINPIKLLMPVALASSYGFMLPTANSTNDLIRKAAEMKITQMMVPGICMDLIAFVLQLIMINTLGKVTFTLNEFPKWAERTIRSMRLNINITTEI